MIYNKTLKELKLKNLFINNNEQCSICYENMTNIKSTYMLDNCNHIFCKTCVLSLLNHNKNTDYITCQENGVSLRKHIVFCPLCRAENTIIKIQNNEKMFNHDNTPYQRFIHRVTTYWNDSGGSVFYSRGTAREQQPIASHRIENSFIPREHTFNVPIIPQYTTRTLNYRSALLNSTHVDTPNSYTPQHVAQQLNVNVNVSDDIIVVMTITGCSYDTAKRVLQRESGNVERAIMRLQRLGLRGV